MANPKDVLVITTSSVDGLTVKKYLKPVSAHIVAGTNLFSDFLGGLTDVFGGRSKSYQKQLASIYNEAIERIKYAAHEIGANCVVGLSIDLDEISGKNKSMFMLTAIGTAAVLEKEVQERGFMSQSANKFENVGVERINLLRSKRALLEKANQKTLKVDDEVWGFITDNQVHELFPYVLKKFSDAITLDRTYPGTSDNYYKSLVGFVDALPEQIKLDLIYKAVKEEEIEYIASKLLGIIKEANLFDFNRCLDLLQSDKFLIKKRGLGAVSSDQLFYSKEDKTNLEKIRDYISRAFVERGSRTTKKQLLSSKEKEVWSCECGKTNDIGTYCSGCEKDIYGFKPNEAKPKEVLGYLDEKIDLIAAHM